MKEILKEKIFKVESRYYDGRFWVPQENYSIELKTELIETFHEMNGNYLSGGTAALAQYFCENYNINAIEIVTKDGTGSVYYNGWP